MSTTQEDFNTEVQAGNARILCAKHAKHKRTQTSVSLLLATILKCMKETPDTVVRKMISNNFAGRPEERDAFTCIERILNLIVQLGVFNQKELCHDFIMSIRNIYTKPTSLDAERVAMWHDEIFTLKFQCKDILPSIHSLPTAELTMMEHEIFTCLRIMYYVEWYIKLDEARLIQGVASRTNANNNYRLPPHFNFPMDQ